MYYKNRKDMQTLRKSPEEEQREVNSIIDESGLDLNPRVMTLAEYNSV